MNFHRKILFLDLQFSLQQFRELRMRESETKKITNRKGYRKRQRKEKKEGKRKKGILPELSSGCGTEGNRSWIGPSLRGALSFVIPFK